MLLCKVYSYSENTLSDNYDIKIQIYESPKVDDLECSRT